MHMYDKYIEHYLSFTLFIGAYEMTETVSYASGSPNLSAL